MNNRRLLISLICLFIPFIVRYLYDNTGIPETSRIIPTPEYLQLSNPRPPLSTPLPLISAPVKGSGIVIFDVFHNNGFSFSEIEPFTRSLNSRGMKIELNDGRQSLGEYLKRASAYVILNPTTISSPDEVKIISAFIKKGGRLLLITDPTRAFAGAFSALYQAPASAGSSSPAATFSTDVANHLLSPFGITFQEDYVYNTTANEGNFRNIVITNINRNDLTAKINRLVFYSAHSIKTSQTILLRGDSNTFSSITDSGADLPLAALDNTGRVLALGDLTFLTQPYDQVADNQQLVANITQFLSVASPTRELVDFPYIFNENLTILVDPSSPSETRLLTTLSTIQKTFGGFGVTIQMATTARQNSDLLVTGTFPPDKQIETYTKSFSLTFSGLKTSATSLPTVPVVAPSPMVSISPLSGTRTPTPLKTFRLPTLSPRSAITQKAGPMVSVPGFGSLSTNGLGLIMYSNNPERNVLILLADTKANLSALTDMVATGRLKNCTLISNIAACSLTISKNTGGGSFELDLDDDENSGGGFQSDEAVG